MLSPVLGMAITASRWSPEGDEELRNLIRRMADENPDWGAPRMHGEVLKLGFEVSERTVALQTAEKPPPRHPAGRWRAFLSNHQQTIAPFDFFTVPTVTFRLLYCFS
jgi:hypothetical protein